MIIFKIIGFLVYPAIIILGGCTFYVLTFNVGRGIDSLKKSRDNDKNRDENELTENGDVYKHTAAYSMELENSYLDRFNSILVDYQSAIRTIPMFTMLGLFGTVVGLIQQLGNENMIDALGTSMYTTFWGLLVALVLKGYDTFKISKKVTAMSNEFENLNNQYQIGKDKKILNEKK